MACETLGFKVKLFPSRVKADTLAALAALFTRLHTDATQQITASVPPRQPSTKGQEEFVGRATRRAWIDYKRGEKAARIQRRTFKLPFLTADILDAAEV